MEPFPQQQGAIHASAPISSKEVVLDFHKKALRRCHEICYDVQLLEGRAGYCEGSCTLKQYAINLYNTKCILIKQNKNINNYKYSGNKPYYSCTLQLPIYLIRSALAESNNLYLQSLVIKPNILGRPIPVCLLFSH